MPQSHIDISYRQSEGTSKVFPRSGSADRGSNRAGSRNSKERKTKDIRPRTQLKHRPGNESIDRESLKIVRTSSLTNADNDMSRISGFKLKK